MSEGWAQWILSGLVGVIMVMFGEMIRRLFKRQDELEATKANKDSTDKRFEQILDELKEQRRDFKDHSHHDDQNFKDVLAAISETNGHLSNLVGRFDATNGQR